MGLWSSVKSIASGRPRDAFNYLWVPESEIARSNNLDNRLQEMVAEDVASGVVTHEQAMQTYGRIAENAFIPGGIFDQPGTNPWGGFKEGALEGADNIRNAVGGGINSILGLGLKLIPWQVWALVIVAAAIYFWPIIAPALGFAGRMRPR